MEDGVKPGGLTNYVNNVSKNIEDIGFKSGIRFYSTDKLIS